MSEMNERSGAAAGSIAKDAAARGMELALIPMKDVPPLALDFLRHLAKKVGDDVVQARHPVAVGSNRTLRVPGRSARIVQ